MERPVAHENEMTATIDAALARQLVGAQFPRWADLPVSQLTADGWDNRSFRLGQEMVVRLPSAAAYASQVDKEQYWLPRLAPFLPLEIPLPIALGNPGSGYPWRWSIYRWVDGETIKPGSASTSSSLARAIAEFLVSLQKIDPATGPLPGPHNFFRGGPLITYDAEARAAIRLANQRIDAPAAMSAWLSATSTTWENPPLWIHGDIAAGNLLTRRGNLSAVIDFGNLGVGDPACDLAIAWTLFEGDARKAFRASLPLDRGTWARARGWALWKALIIAARLSTTNAIEFADPWRIIAQILSEGESIDT